MRFYYIIQGLLWLLILVCLLSLQGCVAYTAVSVASYATTGKGVGDHVASTATGGDCNLIKHTYTGEYVCEMPVVYNRNGF